MRVLDHGQEDEDVSHHAGPERHGVDEEAGTQLGPVVAPDGVVVVVIVLIIVADVIHVGAVGVAVDVTDVTAVTESVEQARVGL